MPPMKRPASASPAQARGPGRPKKAAKAKSPGRPKKAAEAPKQLDPIDAKCQQVTEELKQLEALPPAVAAMLGDVIPFSLRLCREERHAWQQAAVEAVGREMGVQEEKLEGAVKEAEAQVEQLAGHREAQEAAAAEVEAQLKEIQVEVQGKKHVLADAALDFRGAREALAEAEARQESTDKDLVEAARKHADLSSAIINVLEPLKEGTMPREEVQAAATGLVPRLQAFFEVEESLVPAIPAVLAKEPAARGSFDAMAAVQLEGQARKALDELAATAKGAEAAQAERSAGVRAAQEALAASRERQRGRASAFMASQAKEEEAEAKLRATKEKIRALGPERMRRRNAVSKAEKALEVFRDGALATFKELCDRSGQPPPAPAPAAEEPPAEGAAAEAMPAAEAEPDTKPMATDA